MKKFVSVPKYRRWRRPSNDLKGVSEAIGTIILLAIAISLIGIVAIWVETLPEAPEHRKVDLLFEHGDLVSGQMTIDIEHQGGDLLYFDETEIRIIVLPTYENYYLSFSDSTTTDLNDNVWNAGDRWSYTLTNVPQNAEIEIKVIDISVDGDRVLFRKELALGKLGPDLPDLEISEDNITLAYSGEFIRKDRPVKITATIFNVGKLNATAIVRFFDGNRLIKSNGKEFWKIDVPYKYSPTAENFVKLPITWFPERWGQHVINVKIYSIQYETNYANNFASKNVQVEFFFEPPQGVDLSVTKYDIIPNIAYPLHGDDINLSIIMHNIGDLPIPSTEPFNVTISLGNRVKTLTFDDGFRARDSMEFYVVFTEIGPGGLTEITVELDTDYTIVESSENNNIAIKPLQILPTILVVDDDNAESGTKDVADKLMKGLKGRGVTFDYYNVKGATDPNPRYDTGPRKLNNFDIVIWVTGYERENTLTPTNIINLKKWLNDPATTNGLWLIGQDVINDTVAIPGTIEKTDFVYEYLGVQEYGWNGTPRLVYGVEDDIITDGMNLNTSNLLANEDRGVNLTHRPLTMNDGVYSILGKENLIGTDPGLAIRYHNLTNTFKVVYFGFEFSSIFSAYDISNVTYHVLRYFNYSLEEGYDFGIVDQQFSTLNPQFMDEITIFATVVNNGPKEESVYVLFNVMDPFGQLYEIESGYPDDIDNPQLITIPGNGGRKIVNKTWLASAVGEHNFFVTVDPYDQYQEIVEENNDFSYYGLEVTKLRIQYTILLVDDDNSSNNAGPYPDTVTPVKNALDNLSYYYVEYIVPGGPMPEDGPNLDTLKHYNAVIWLTGDDLGPTLTPVDQQNLEDYLYGNYIESKYLKIKVNLLLVGQNILDDINGSGNNVVPQQGFVRDYLKVSEYSTNRMLGNYIEGIPNKPISHGCNYPLAKYFMDNSDIIKTTNKNNYLFWQNKLLDQYNSIGYEHEHNHSRIVFLAWELSFIDSSIYPADAGPEENYLYELVYLLMNWFEYPQDSAELRISNIDINISEDNPNIGDSYIITTDIFNHGSEDCSAIVRYYDGNTIIETDTVYVQSKSKTSSEIIWRPLYAGNRTIFVRVDMNNYIPETFEILNNIASVPSLWVYFFYDDLEDGPDNWKHESTILRINGELAGPVSSGKSIVDLILVIDTSSSMGIGSFPDRPIDDAKTAARALIGSLHDESRVAIFKTHTNPGSRNVTLPVEGWITLDEGGRETLMNDPPHYLAHTASPSSELNTQAFTCLWLAVGEAIMAGKTMGRPGKTAIVVLSDGQDYLSDDKGISDPPTANEFSKVEMASAVAGDLGNPPSTYGYCPWIDWGTRKGFDYHWGKYFGNFTNDGYWYKQDNWGTGSSSKVDFSWGLLYAPIPVFTVGLSLETATTPGNINTPQFNYTDYEGNTPTNMNSDGGDVYTGPEGEESGTPEFNLWRIAQSSNAKYYYSPTGDQLTSIFMSIAYEITQVTASRGSSSDMQPSRGSGNAREALEYMDSPVYSDIISNWSEVQGFSKDYSDYYSSNSCYSMREPFGKPTSPFRYEFFLPADKEQGFYAIGVKGMATYDVFKADSNGDWQPLYENQTIRVGQINRYASLDPYYLYMILSSGPLIIVKTSLEGSNVNVPNYQTGSEVGTNFSVLGDKATIFALQPNTRVTIKSYDSINDYNTALFGGTDNFANRDYFTFGSSAKEGTYQVYQFGNAITPIWIHSNKDIIVYRCSRDNDELDTAISTRGESTGEVLYYPYVGDGHPPRIIVYNTGPYATKVNVSEITASHHNPPVPITATPTIIKSDWVIPGYGMDTHGWLATAPGVSVPGDNSKVRTFKVEIVGGDTTGLRVVYGGVSGGKDDFDVEGEDGSSDDTYDLFGFWDGEGKWRISTPLLVGNNGHEDLETRSQHFIVGDKCVIDVDGDVPIAFLDDSLTSNVITYFSVMDTVVHFVTMGTVTNIQVSGVTGASASLVTNTIILPKGKHDTTGNGLSVTASGTGTWYLGIKTFEFQDRGSFAWQLKYVAKWNGTDYSKVRFLPGYPNPESGTFKYCWNYTSENPWIFIIDGKGNCWIHTILPFEGSISTVGYEAQVRSARSTSGSGGSNPTTPIQSPSRGSRNRAEPEIKYMITPSFSLLDVTDARLVFFHKYNLFLGYNGAIIQIGTDDDFDDIFDYKYVQPTQPYSNNLYLEDTQYDDFGQDMRWCWNGISGTGQFKWEYVIVDLSEFINKPRVCIKFLSLLYAGGDGNGGWWVDNVEVIVSRSDMQSLQGGSTDQWELTTTDAHSGNYCWWNHDVTPGNYFKGSLDNSLYSRPIDLTNARNATLSAYFKFNINKATGRPPDGFRVEISSDNGMSWKAINYGVRAAWGLSGNDSDASDGVPGDGKSYTGINESDYWVEADSLTRLNCDLNGWSGEVIILRFRVVTASDSNPYFKGKHYESGTADFGGLYIDDVIIHGFSLQE
ncbi:type IV pilin [[Eubacterium] cellulosolvens]